jgi:hypothetical protein
MSSLPTDEATPAQRSFEVVALPGKPTGLAISGIAPAWDVLAEALSRRLGEVVVDPRDAQIDPCFEWVDGARGDTSLAREVLARDDDDDAIAELPGKRRYYRRASVLPLPAQTYFRKLVDTARRDGRADLPGLGSIRVRPNGAVGFMAKAEFKNALQARRPPALADAAPGVAAAIAKLVTSHEDVLLCDRAVLYAYEIAAGTLAPFGEPVAVAARVAVDVHIV